MAKIIAPFLISGTLEDMNFVITAEGNNYVRSKREGSMTSLEFKTNPIYDPIRNHGHEFGHCSKKSAVFRQLVQRFNNLAKDGSFAGRVNKLLFDILKNDLTQVVGKRTVSEGIKTKEGRANFLLFESNKLRPLHQILKIKVDCIPSSQKLTLNNFIAKEHLDWPENATHVHLASATSNWDYHKNTFQTNYSNTVILAKESELQNIELVTDSHLDSNLLLTFFFIGFAQHNNISPKFLHRKFNTATLIHYSPI